MAPEGAFRFRLFELSTRATWTDRLSLPSLDQRNRDPQSFRGKQPCWTESNGFRVSCNRGLFPPAFKRGSWSRRAAVNATGIATKAFQRSRFLGSIFKADDVTGIATLKATFSQPPHVGLFRLSLCRIPPAADKISCDPQIFFRSSTFNSECAPPSRPWN